jgi:hypothetical protein
VTAPGDPLGRRALFGPPVASPAGPPATGGAVGRRAFFSDAAPAPEARPHVRVTCRSCRTATDLEPLGVLRSLVGSLWWPLGAWNHRMRCPSCDRVGWCRLEWDGMFDWR